MTTDCWPVMFLPSRVCVKIKWCFCQRLYMLQSNLPTNGHFLLAPGCQLWRGSTVIYDEPPLSRDQPPIRGHLPVPRGWPLQDIEVQLTVWSSLESFMPAQSCTTKKAHLTWQKKTYYTAYLRSFVWNRNYNEIFVKLYRLISLNTRFNMTIIICE